MMTFKEYKMNIQLREKYLRTLIKRKNFLVKRVLTSRKDLSYDKLEINALIYSIRLAKKDIEQELALVA